MLWLNCDELIALNRQPLPVPDLITSMLTLGYPGPRNAFDRPDGYVTSFNPVSELRFLLEVMALLCHALVLIFSVSCPNNNSHCVMTAPGAMECLCNDGYYGYKCLRQVHHSILLFILPPSSIR